MSYIFYPPHQFSVKLQCEPHNSIERMAGLTAHLCGSCGIFCIIHLFLGQNIEPSNQSTGRRWFPICALPRVMMARRSQLICTVSCV